jgi:hypothetical protein
MRGEEGEGDEWGGGGGIKGGKGSFVRGLVGCVNERVQRWKKSNGPCREKKNIGKKRPYVGWHCVALKVLFSFGRQRQESPLKQS